MKPPSDRQIRLLAYVPGPDETPQPTCEIWAAYWMAWGHRAATFNLYKPQGTPGVLVNLRNQGLVRSRGKRWGTPHPTFLNGQWVYRPRWLTVWQRTFEV